MNQQTTLLGPDQHGRWVLIDGDRIAETGVGHAPSVGPDVVTIECARSTLEPGSVNAHTHMYSGLAPFGMPAPSAPPQNFLQILERVWWRLDRALDPSSLRASARIYIAESLLHGTTGLIDHHESPRLIDGSLEILADACSDFGIRAVLGYGATERNGGVDEGRAGLAECRRFVAANQSPLLRGTVALHASFTVSDELIRETATLCRELDAPLHVHLAEAASDVADAVGRGYGGPAERLFALDALPPQSICAHGVHLGEEQVRKLDAAQCWLVQNPRSNENNDVGYPKHHAASARVALGTDGFPANMADERAALERLGASHGDDRSALHQRPTNSRALLGEYFAASFDFADGALADIVVRDGSEARHVFVAGQPVVRDGTLVRHDIDEIRAAAEAEAKRLWQRMAEL